MSTQQTDTISNTQREKRKAQNCDLDDQEGVDCDYEKNVFFFLNSVVTSTI